MHLSCIHVVQKPSAQGQRGAPEILETQVPSSGSPDTGMETFSWAEVFHCAKLPKLPFSRIPHGPKELLEPRGIHIFPPWQRDKEGHFSSLKVTPCELQAPPLFITAEHRSQLHGHTVVFLGGWVPS